MVPPLRSTDANDADACLWHPWLGINHVTSAILVAVVIAGCAVSPDIVLRHKDGHKVVCEHVTGLYGVRTYTLLTIQRQRVEDYQRHGYDRVPSAEGSKR